MIAACLGYNDLHVTIGVFESLERAKEVLLASGCIEKRYPVYHSGKPTGKMGHPKIVTTQAFEDFMEQKGLSCYSTGAPMSEEWAFQFLPVKLNEVCIGYNDD